jgi:hypothetical protein
MTKSDAEDGITETADVQHIDASQTWVVVCGLDVDAGQPRVRDG